MKYTQMMIGEVVADDLTKEIVQLIKDHVRSIPRPAGHSIVVEDGGRMVILITDWDNREDCLNYHSSRAYRQFVAAAQHMLIGNFVEKLFQNRT
jgi:hypothetical protein